MKDRGEIMVSLDAIIEASSFPVDRSQTTGQSRDRNVNAKREIILTAIAARFERTARVLHDDRLPCRKTSSNSCTYEISW